MNKNIVSIVCTVIVAACVAYLMLSPSSEKIIFRKDQNFDYPINMDMTSYLGSPKLPIEFIAEDQSHRFISLFHNVTYQPKDHTFMYTYKLSYLGKKKCMLQWEFLNQLNKKIGVPTLLELTPDTIREFTLVSEKHPIFMTTSAQVYLPTADPVIWELIPLKTNQVPTPSQ